MQARILLACFALGALIAIALAAESSTSGTSNTSSSSSTSSSTSGSRQGVASAVAAGSGLFTTLSSFLPTGLASFLPVALLFGLGALMVPAFGLGMLLREGRRSDTYNVQPNLAYATQALRNGQMGNMQAQANSNAQPLDAQNFHYYRSLPSFSLNSGMMLEVLDKVMKALDNADKAFN